MSDNLKPRAGIVYQVTESVILAVSVGLVTWTSNTVISQGKAIATMNNQIITNTERLNVIEQRGSGSLREHEKEDDARIAELTRGAVRMDAVVTELRTTPGELKTINVRLDGLTKSLERIETQISQHLIMPQIGTK
jgi:hypothetical protein